MEIRSTCPSVFTNDGAKFIAQMEALGFRVAHQKRNAGGTNVTLTIMKDDNDNSISITENERFSTPFSGIRMNVDYLPDALAEFKALGYVNLLPNVTDTKTSYATLLRSPEGIFVAVVEHIK